MSRTYAQAVAAEGTWQCKRGDTVAVVRRHRDYVIGQGTTERVTVELGTVTNATREGVAKRVALVDWADESPSTPLEVSRHRLEVRTLPGVDGAAARAAYARRRYPSAPESSMVYPFQSVDEARAFLASFRVSA